MFGRKQIKLIVTTRKRSLVKDICKCYKAAYIGAMNTSYNIKNRNGVIVCEFLVPDSILRRILFITKLDDLGEDVMQFREIPYMFNIIDQDEL